MKRKLILITVIFGIIVLYSGCKKGDEDPFISLLSRKARVCGDWKVTEGRITYGTPDIIETYDFKSDGRLTITLQQGIIDGTYDWTFEIKKDGSYKIYQNLHIPYTSTYTLNEEGYWYFLTKNKGADIKNKEYIAFQPVEVRENLSFYEYQTSAPTVYDIIQLKNNKMKFVEERVAKETDESALTETIIDENIILTRTKD
jgi:hypothetical protein